jgi:20S proteasome subunit alpha 5
MSGLIADARTLVEKGRTEAQVSLEYLRMTKQNYRFTYNEPMRTESLTQAICDYCINFGEEGAPMVFFLAALVHRPRVGHLG